MEKPLRSLDWEVEDSVPGLLTQSSQGGELSHYPRKCTMANPPATGSIWHESMRIGIPAYDEQRRDLVNIIELLDISAGATITDEYFLGRFSALQVMISEYFAREESLMVQLGVPAQVKDRIVSEHDQILGLLNQVYLDSMNKTGRSPLDVYYTVRSALEESMRAHGQLLRDHLQHPQR